jgi:hypothetical protein
VAFGCMLLVAAMWDDMVLEDKAFMWIVLQY